MSRILGRGALQQYQQIGVESSIMDATPHRLVQMLFEGALDNIAKAKGLVICGEILIKCRHIDNTMSIIDHLAGTLNLEAGGELANNLATLYDYIGRRLFQANLENSVDMLDEVANLLLQIKEGWDAIGNKQP